MMLMFSFGVANILNEPSDPNDAVVMTTVFSSTITVAIITIICFNGLLLCHLKVYF